MWFYSTGMAFNKVGHQTLVDALQQLTPSSVVPTRQQLASTLLDSCYEEARSQNMLRIANKYCTLATDAWTDINGKAVINYVLLFSDMTVFLESVYTGSEAHDAPFVAEDIERVIAKLPFLTVSAVVTDNTATNWLVWSNLQQRYPKVFFHGCVSHVLRLAAKDLLKRLPWHGKLAANCRQLVRFFKKNQQLWYEIKRLQHLEGKSSLVLPAETRWGTIERCFASVLASERILYAFVTARGFLRGRNKEQKAKRRHAHDTIVASDFVTQLEKALSTLSVLSAFQKAFESNAKPPSDVYHMLLQLPKMYNALPIPISELGKITQVIKEQFDFVYDDAHGVGYMLDPRYLGAGMDESTRERVQSFITEWNGIEHEEATMVELIKYLGSPRASSLEAKLIRKKQLSALEYWNGLSQFPLLREIALTVFSACCSSAAAERNFSAHKFVHSQARNRLQGASVEKLVFLFFNTRNFDNEDVTFFEMVEDLAEESEGEADNNEDSDFEYY